MNPVRILLALNLEEDNLILARGKHSKQEQTTGKAKANLTESNKL